MLGQACDEGHANHRHGNDEDADGFIVPDEKALCNTCKDRCGKQADHHHQPERLRLAEHSLGAGNGVDHEKGEECDAAHGSTYLEEADARIAKDTPKFVL